MSWSNLFIEYQCMTVKGLYYHVYLLNKSEYGSSVKTSKHFPVKRTHGIYLMEKARNLIENNKNTPIYIHPHHIKCNVVYMIALYHSGHSLNYTNMLHIWLISRQYVNFKYKIDKVKTKIVITGEFRTTFGLNIRFIQGLCWSSIKQELSTQGWPWSNPLKTTVIYKDKSYIQKILPSYSFTNPIFVLCNGDRH